MTQEIREKYGADTRDCDPWPYSFQTYVLRVLWLLAWLTVWRLCWKRFSRLRCLILRIFGAKTGVHAHIAGSAWIEMPWNLTLGEYATIGARARVYNLGQIVLGDHAVVSQDVDLCGGSHDFNDPTYPLIRETIEIGEYAWIAAGAFVLPGLKVGKGAVVAARAVVTRDVDPWTIVAGNPAKKIGEREMRKHESREKSKE